MKQTDPDVFFTTIAYPIKGTPYFDAVEDRTQLPVEWATASDRDYVIAGRNGREYYRWADEWLRSEVEAVRVTPATRRRAPACAGTARRARDELVRMQHESRHARTP